MILPTLSRNSPEHCPLNPNFFLLYNCSASAFYLSSIILSFTCLDCQTECEVPSELDRLPQELLLLDHQDADQEIDTEATEYIEPGRKKGKGKSEDAAIKLEQLYNPAGTSEEFNL